MQSTAMTVASVATSDAKLFDAAVEYYKKLGFLLNEDWSPRTGSASLHRAHGSEREVTLILPADESGQEAALTVRLSPLGLTAEEANARIERFQAASDSTDWRTIFPATMFPVSRLEANHLNALPIAKQANPPVGDPVELFVYDPLGNLVGFTTHNNPVSQVPKRKVEAPAPAVHASGAGAGASVSAGKEAAAVPVILPSDNGAGQRLPESVRPHPVADAAKRKIAVLTSGGDAPGMNSAVRAVIRTGIHNGCEMFAVYEGYEGLVNGGRYIERMEWDDVRGYLSIGGTSIGTARSMAFKERAGRRKAAHNLVKQGINSLVVCGGDGSLTGADRFRHEWPELIEELRESGDITAEAAETHRHLYICGMVGSIDNDMAMTDVTIGAYSSLDRICRNVDWIEATAKSHSRAFVIEVMGRNCGWLALLAAIATHADYLFIPERPPVAGKWAEEMQDIVRHHKAAGRRRTIVIIAEGAIDTELNPIQPSLVKEALVELGLDTRITTLGHIQRGGPAVAFDRLLATMQGAAAVKAILEATPETPSPMIGMKENHITKVSLVDAVRETQEVAAAIAAKDFERARGLRDAEFKEHLKNYLLLSSSDQAPAPENAAKEPLKIAIVAVGAPAGGMNAAIASAVAYCYARGHKAYAIHNSWSGLARHESVRDVSWMEAEDMFAQGGCEIGTNRQLPTTDLGMISYYFGKYGFDGLIIIGGFEAFRSLQILQGARSTYPAFRIPMVCLPATISNNVPGSEYSLGTDTCLNSLVEYTDVVKQSASSTRRRVFIVEVQGGASGYIASYCGLVCGAHAVYTPEDGISLSQMSADIKHLRENFAQDQGRQRAGRLVIRNEKASPGFTTLNLASIFETESHGKFDAREAIPGHLQQGGQPSPMDRVRAARLAIRCVQFIEDNMHYDRLSDAENESSACVLGVRQSKVVTTPITTLWEYETDVEHRRPKHVHWKPLLDMANVMTERPIVTVNTLESSNPTA